MFDIANLLFYLTKVWEKIVELQTTGQTPPMSPEAMAAGKMVGQWTKKRELMNREWMKAVAVQVRNGHLLYGSITIVVKNLAWCA